MKIATVFFLISLIALPVWADHDGGTPDSATSTNGTPSGYR